MYKDNDRYCCYCNVEFNQLNRKKQKTKDHLIPLSKGGANNQHNKRNACEHCNTQKGSQLPHEYLKTLEGRLATSNSTDEIEVLTAKIKNLRVVVKYVENSGPLLFSKGDRYKWFKRRFMKDKKHANEMDKSK